MAESALREYEYGGDGFISGAFMPYRREIISPEQQLTQGYASTRRGIGVDIDAIPAKYGEVETGFEYTPIVRGVKSALNFIGEAFSDPEQAFESAKTVAPQALAGINQYMNDQYQAGALGGTTYNPETGQVTEFDPIGPATMLAPGGFLARGAATPGSVTLGIMGGKNTKYTPDQIKAAQEELAKRGIVQNYPKSYKPQVIDNYVSQGVDPRTFAAGAGENSGDPRVGQMGILGGTTINIGDPRIGDVRQIDLADYEGYPFFTSMSDRAAAGDVILDINGVPVNVSRRGGHNYMFDPESGEFVWASDKDVILKKKGDELSGTSFFKTATNLKNEYGKDPLIIPWTMAPTGIDFSTQIGETMLSYARNAMSRSDLVSLNKDVEKIIPDWPGIDNPDWLSSFRNTTGNQRKAVANLLDKSYVNKGSITSGIARYANIDPDLRMVRDGQLVNAGIVDTSRYPMTDNTLVHPTYNTGLYGEGIGRIGGDIQVFEMLPEASQLMGVVDPLNPSRNALRALEMKPYSGVITESALRAIEIRRR